MNDHFSVSIIQFKASVSPPNDPDHDQWMAKAIALAAQAGAAGEVPVGAVIIGPEGDCLAEGENRRERDRDPTAHAEILALKAASRVIQSWRLQDCTLYVTLEPCPMCAGAIIQARIGLLVYGASDPKTGAVRTVLNLPDSPCSFHKLTVISGIQEARCRQQLQTWFAHRRGQHKQQKLDVIPQSKSHVDPPIPIDLQDNPTKPSF